MPKSRKDELSLVQGRAVDAAIQILGEDDPKAKVYLHTALTQCFLPYREPKETSHYMRESGNLTLVVSSGVLFNPKTRKPQIQGIPYGAKPRLLMMHLCSEAIKRQSKTIPIEDSMSAFMEQLGLAVTGGKKGTIGGFKEQLNRLAAARLQLLMAFDNSASIINPAPVISKFDVWFPQDPKQKTLWPSEITISDEFYESLKHHALPLDVRGVRGIQHSARALDLYVWLAHRLPRVKSKTGEKITWQALKPQFGGTLSDDKNFKRHMLEALRFVKQAYPKAQIEQVESGLVLKRSDPPIKKKLL